MTPRTREQNEAIRQQRMYQIRNTAATVFLEKGISMEMGDVAKKAGLGRGTVYHYYNNKISLIEDLLTEALEEASKNTMDTLRIPEAPLTRLEHYAKRQLESWVQHPFVFILYKHVLQAEPLPIQNTQELLHNFELFLHRPVIQTIEEAIQTGEIMSLQAETVGNLFFGTLIGTATSYIGKNDSTVDIAHSAWIGDVTTVLFRGLRA